MTVRRKLRDSKGFAARPAVARSRVSNGKDVLPGVDGRSLIARRYYDILAELSGDQGGGMSEARKQLCRRFAAASVLAEQMEARMARGEKIDLAEHALLSSTLVRLASRIGVDRRARNVTPALKDYLASKSRSRIIEHEEDGG